MCFLYRCERSLPENEKGPLFLDFTNLQAIVLFYYKVQVYLQLVKKAFEIDVFSMKNMSGSVIVQKRMTKFCFSWRKDRFNYGQAEDLNLWWNYITETGQDVHFFKLRSNIRLYSKSSCFLLKAISFFCFQRKGLWERRKENFPHWHLIIMPNLFQSHLRTNKLTKKNAIHHEGPSYVSLKAKQHESNSVFISFSIVLRDLNFAFSFAS